MKLFISLLLCGALAFGALHFSSIFKSDEELIRDRIQEFEDAYNDGDMEAVLECLEPSIKNAYSAMYGIAGSFMSGKIGFNASISELFAIGTVTAMEDGLHIEINEIVIDGNHATVRVTIRSGSFSEAGRFKMVKDNREWYIRDGGSNIK